MTRARLALLATALAIVAAPAGAEELNALVWCDHTDDALIEPFEEAHGVTVNLKEYEGTGAALSIIEQSQPGDWDVLVIDGIDVPRAVEAEILAPLDREALPLDDIPQPVALLGQQMIEGELYAVTEKYGYNTISFDRSKVSADELASMEALYDPKHRDRIAIYDYYLPVIGMVAVGLGKETADLTEDDLPAISEKLSALKANARSVGEVVASQTALATGEVDILVGGGEWVTAGLTAENPDLDWIIPEEGAVRWSQSIGIFADSQRKELAMEFVKYILSPEGQARLATSSCYWAMPANRKAGEHLSDEQKAALRWDDQDDYLERAQLYPAPDADLDRAMQDAWTEMLQQ